MWRYSCHFLAPDHEILIVSGGKESRGALQWRALARLRTLDLELQCERGGAL